MVPSCAAEIHPAQHNMLMAVLRSTGYKVDREVCWLNFILDLDLCSKDILPYAITWIPTPYSVC
jgi:hypothetical protein